MKRIILIISCFMLTNLVKAQWTVNGSNVETDENIKLTNTGGHFFSVTNNDSSTEPTKMFVSGYDYTRGLQIGRDDGNHKILLTGNVGIGFNQPTYKLEVNGTGRFADNLFIDNSKYIYLGSTNDRIKAESGNIGIYPNAHFYIGAIISGNEVKNVAFLENGNVGVGTTNPSNKLEIKSDLSGTNAALESENDLNISSYFYTGRSGNSGITNKTIIENANANPILLNPSGGGVGIGTTSPSGNLEIKNSETTGVPTVLNLENSNSDILALKFTEDIIESIPANYWQFRLGGAGGHQGLIFSHLNNNTILTLNKTGTVGIGTTVTGSHKLAVEGSIGAREVKVEVGPGWSDFVFENDYELRTLEEVEDYITQNKHLPEIPSEAEVTENGINLGEMDAKLLQKIEELTLYVIEMNKQMAELKAKNEQLEKVVSALINE